MGKISSNQILNIFINVRQIEFAADWMWGMKGRKESWEEGREEGRKEDQR